MKDLREIIEKISNTASTKEKEKLLKDNVSNFKLFQLLELHLNPFRQFYVTKLPVARPDAKAFPFMNSTNYDRFLQLTGILHRRTVTGHEALAAVYDFFKDCNEDEAWVFQTILLKEPLNFGAKLINKVKPRLIPEFGLMLADAKQPKLADIKYPIIAQTKLDGFRCVYFPKERVFMGRNGKPVRNENLNKYFEEFVKRNTKHVIDGELYSDTLSFNEIASILNSEDKPLDGIYYCAYDFMREDEWACQKSVYVYLTRINNLAIAVKQWNKEGVKNVSVVTSEDLQNEAAVQNFYQWALDQGFEGLMLKDPNGAYQWKRVTVKSGIMMKLKPHDEYDGQIIGFEEGTGQHKGMLGSFIVEVEGIRNAVSVGSGFTEAQRTEIWKNPYPYVRQWIKLKGFEVTEGKESLRFPIFLSFRDSK
jgi:DNA ligase-1